MQNLVFIYLQFSSKKSINKRKITLFAHFVTGSSHLSSRSFSFFLSFFSFSPYIFLVIEAGLAVFLNHNVLAKHNLLFLCPGYVIKGD